MRRKRRSVPPNIYEMFSDIALLMLATFIFLLVTILITARMAEQYQAPRLKNAIANLQAELNKAEADRKRLKANMDALASLSSDSQMEKALAWTDGDPAEAIPARANAGTFFDGKSPHRAGCNTAGISTEYENHSAQKIPWGKSGYLPKI